MQDSGEFTIISESVNGLSVYTYRDMLRQLRIENKLSFIPWSKNGQKAIGSIFQQFLGQHPHLAHFCFVAMCNFYQNKRGLT